MFLTRLSALIGSLVAGKVLANTAMLNNRQHGEHGQLSGQAHNQGHCMQRQSLLADSALPTGQPFASLKPLANLSQQAGEFVATLEVKPLVLSLTDSIQTEFWTYNGQIPGPMIEVYEGDTVKITVKNYLSQATTVHWHGLPVPPEQDGNPQDEIPAGGERVYQ